MEKTSTLAYKAMQRETQLTSLSLLPDTIRTGGFFYLPQCTSPEAALARRLPKVLWVKEVDVDPAISMTGSSGASSLSSSHSSKIAIFR